MISLQIVIVTMAMVMITMMTVMISLVYKYMVARDGNDGAFLSGCVKILATV